ncbi:MAG: hypothetical protein ACOY5V_10395 [Pseudomonadota bacterium]
MAGSERAERFAFSPTGGAGAGGIRQWRRRATAIVGRRFDDLSSFDKYFERVK